MIARTDLAKIIAERTLHVTDLTKLKKAVAGFLLEQNKTSDLEPLMRDVLVYRAQHGHVEATVVSAFPLNASLKQQVMTALRHEYPEAKTYVLNEHIDPSVVGGIRLEVGGEELDLTVRAKLNILKRLTAVGETV